MNHLTNYWIVSLHFCFSDIYLSKTRTPFLKGLAVKRGVTPRAIRNVRPSLQL
jgi:hypothetical protein